MSSFWNFAFGALLVIIWIIAGGFVTKANVYLSPYKDNDSDLHRAYWFTFWAAFVTWFLIGVFIILIILSVIGVVALFGSGAGEVGVAAEGGAAAAEGGAVTAEGAETAEVSRTSQAKEYAKSPQGRSAISTGISWVTMAFLIFALILVGITGVLSAVAASSMTRSSNFNPSISKLKTAYTDCIISASICLGAGGLLIIGIIVYFIVGLQRQNKIDAQNKYLAQQRQLELSEIREAKEQALRKKVEQQALFRQELQQAKQKALIQKVYQQPVST